ncbi:hypothetical protein Thiowin_03201 [Thiorhodovibrio winogradskyi]|uniref:PEP-CTERM protein-sorting domain-containing protein n=1 Tax=Thiorhodovibrio winogradskyi TaxID=77007 RepID=A0ABZ0SCF1_9GAMM|nr:hypothetical protein [Thiorhodovibrio winogradskyi]
MGSTSELSYTGIGNLDFTEAGASKGFYLRLPSPIQEPMTIAFDVQGSEFERTFLDGSVGDDFFFPFMSFTDQGVFSDVIYLTMTMSSTNTGWDASIDLLETRPTPTDVPIPGTLSLLTLGLVGLRLRRRNRNEETPEA